MPFLVEKLIEGRPEPVTVRQEATVLEALDLMLEKDFSQLPVIDERGRPQGMVTYEGIVHGVRNFGSGFGDLHVRDVLMSAPLFNLEDDLFDLLEQLKRTNAVLIVDAIGKLAGIVTSYDSTEFFRSRAEDLMQVEDIEVMVKEFALLPFTKDDGNVDKERLADAIAKVTPTGQANARSKLPEFDELTLWQYVLMLVARDTWSTFEDIFKVDRDYVRRMLEKVRDTRNDLAHFRNDIAASQANALRFCARWLSRRREEYDLARRQAFTLDVGQLATQLTHTSAVVREPTALYETGANDGEPHNPLVDKGIIAEETQTVESRYAPLVDWLQSQPPQSDPVQLSFDEIEAIIGGSLLPSARTHRAWWANDPRSHPQSQVWLDASWRTVSVNMTEGRVTFARIRERAKAYIDFFSRVLARLREEADFPIRDVSPGGASWHVCQIIAADGLVYSHFSYSFTRNRLFRVELYLDTSSQESTKRIFDLIAGQRAELEYTLGDLSWERLDDRRASRIALYHEGAITDSKERLDELETWAVDTMIAFYKAVEPVASQAIREVLPS